MFEIRFLGPFSAEINGSSILPSAAKPRHMLALLAFNRSLILSQRLLVEQIWYDKRAPSSAGTAIQTYVMKLRRAIDAHQDGLGRKMLVTHQTGYSLQCEDLTWRDDVSVFRNQLKAAEYSYGAKDYRTASALFAKSLSAWRGPAFQNVSGGTLLENTRLRLEMERIAAYEKKIRSDIASQNLSGAMADLYQLLEEYPLNEKLCCLMMLAQYRSGRAADAIRTYNNLRGRLAVELGMDPDPTCQHLFEAILQRQTELLNHTETTNWVIEDNAS